MPAESRHSVIVALDFPTSAQALELVKRLGAAATSYKVGLQLLTAEGPAIIRELVKQDKKVLLDLKLLEIPNSVAGAITAAGALGVSWVTVHASAGSTVLRAAVEAARAYRGLKILALTVITSMRQEDLNEVGVDGSVLDQVERLAMLAAASGCDGIVASAQEASHLRRRLPVDMQIVTPGIQLVDEAERDQGRVATPADAVRAGSSHLVIGRSIARASNPEEAFANVQREIELALTSH